jgi:hypothetical protein
LASLRFSDDSVLAGAVSRMVSEQSDRQPALALFANALNRPDTGPGL